MIQKLLENSLFAAILGAVIVVSTAFISRAMNQPAEAKVEERTKTFGELKDQRDSINEALEATSVKNQELLDKSETLRTKLDDKLLRLADLQRDTAQIEGDTFHLETAYRAAERKHADLMKELDRLAKTARADLSDVVTERAQLEKELADTLAQLETLKQGLATRVEQIKLLDEALTLEQDAFNALKTKVAGIQSGIDAQKSAFGTLSSEFSALQSRWADVEAHYNELKARVSTLRETRNELKKRLGLA